MSVFQPRRGRLAFLAGDFEAHGPLADAVLDRVGAIPDGIFRDLIDTGLITMSGRGADIFFVDGAPVTSSNIGAERVVLELARIDGPLRPDELGHPFGSIGFPGGFTDADHADHIHIGFD